MIPMSSVQLNVNINFQQLVDTVKKLSPKEKMLIYDVLWEGGLDIPEEHQKLVLDRVKKARQNPSRLIDWDQAAKKLRP
jgi:hypothetical protein